MARRFGLSGGLWTIGLTGLVTVPPLALLAPEAAIPAGAVLAFSALALMQRRFAAVIAAQEKLSGEIGILSQRLIKVETVAAATARAQLDQASRRLAEREAAEPAIDGKMLDATIDTVESEIGLLSGIVRELASVVAAQEGEITRLKAVPRPPEPLPAPAPRFEPTLEPKLDGRLDPKFDPKRDSEVEAEPVPDPRDIVDGRKPAGPARRVPPPVRPAAFVPPALVPPAAVSPRDPEREAAIVAAFDGEGPEIWLQPVVTLPQRKVVSYEALARLRLGTEILAPDAFLSVLERHGRTTALDRAMLQRVATIARHLQRRGSAAVVAYALSPHSLYEPGFLRSLAKLGAGEKDLAGRVVIALPQSSWRNLDAEQTALLASLRGAVGFCLDRPTSLRFDTAALAERGVAQVKVPAALLLQPHTAEAMPDIALEDLVAALGRAGIRLVATEVEREADVPDLIDLDVPMAQGPVFASPKAVRAEVFAAAAPVPAPPAMAPDEPEPPPQRRPFREFLRRAV